MSHFLIVGVCIRNCLSQLILVVVGVRGCVGISQTLRDAGVVRVRHRHRHVRLRRPDAGDTRAEGGLLGGNPGQACSQTWISEILRIYRWLNIKIFYFLLPMMVGIAGTRKAAGFSRNGGLRTGLGPPRINCLSWFLSLLEVLKGFLDGLFVREGFTTLFSLSEGDVHLDGLFLVELDCIIL